MKESHALQARDLPALVVEGLTRRFRGKTALDGVGFVVPAASFTVLLGSAGAGKTTLLRAIAGLDRPDAGRVLLAGRDVGGWEPKDRNVAMILDNLALYPNKTGYQNIASPLVIRGESRSEIERKVVEVAATLKISHILNRLPRTMSGGERQRIALGRALVRTPSLFLLDEPLSSLDAMLRIELRAELKRLQRDLGYSFLLATPDYNEALAIGDTVIMLREGRVVQTSEPQALYDEPVDRDVARFVGAPQINLVDARLTEADGVRTIEAAGARLPVPPHLKGIPVPGGCSFQLGIRPENLRLTDPSHAHAAAAVVDIEPLGLKSVVSVRNEYAELRILVESSVARSVAPGQTAGIEAINLSKLLAFDSSTGVRLNGKAG